MADRYKSVVVVEDGIAHGGIASALSEMVRTAGLNIPIHSIGVPLTFIEHSSRAEILSDLGITAQNIAREIVAWSSASSISISKAEMPLPQDENVHRR
jgi:1-deoxy-D-xylulose-5-phosphate synthase